MIVSASTPPESDEEKKKAAEEKKKAEEARKAGYQPREFSGWVDAFATGAVSVPAGIVAGALVFYITRAVRLYQSNNTLWLIVAGLIGLSLPVIAIIRAKYFGKLGTRNLALIARAPTPGTDEFESLVDAWKVIVDVQMHFNDMLMRTRNYALTLLLGVLAGAGVALERAAVLDVGHTTGKISLASILLLLGVGGLLAFYFLDRFYYHNLLVGSVHKAVEIETWVFDTFPALDLGAVITTHSRIKIRRAKFYARHKLTLFYLVVALLLAGMASLVKNVGISKEEGSAQKQQKPLCSSAKGKDSVVIWRGPDCESR